MKLTSEELHILQHSLGVDKHGQGRPYRNHYCTGPDCDTFAACVRLAGAGLMRDHGAKGELTGGMHVFTVTGEGIDAVALQSSPPSKLSPSARRYREWLRSDCGMSFGEWLKLGGWRARKEAA